MVQIFLEKLINKNGGNNVLALSVIVLICVFAGFMILS